MLVKGQQFLLSFNHYLNRSFSHFCLSFFILFSLLNYVGDNFFFSLSLHPGPIYHFPSLLSFRPAPFNTRQLPPPHLSAQAIFVFDPLTKTILYQKNSSLPLSPASLTKIITALTAKQFFTPQQILQVPSQINTIIGHKIHLQPHEQLTFLSLLQAMLISSANDAAFTIAANFPQGYQAFINQLNQTATNIPLSSTHLTNPIGLDSPYHLSTARDMALFASRLLNDPLLTSIVATRQTTIIDISGKQKHHLVNTNQLLWHPHIQGVKTGWTEKAKECLVIYYHYNNRRFISVILGSNHRFAETLTLINWLNHNFIWKKPSP